ncbi:major facilitator superfamily transporter [Purpureocillium lavendulum]|uniref:Major facilitator superfamily transporter n=1 Tax=Purpureocillium lavendulum TaxID=1247861 RepID=A0AB34FZV8_9HYPO|nr:major facilitator superfamily transporter [Purpureocillium lavendulum]
MDNNEKTKGPGALRPEPTGSSNSHVVDTASEICLSKDGFKLFPQPVTGDKLDPLNWSWIQKHTILAIIMALYFMFTYITTTTVPSFPGLQEKYAASLAQINWTVAIPALGLSLGPLLCASPADIIGRRPVFILGTTAALASTVGAALAPTYSSYMAARFFQGLGVSPASNVGLAVINDVFFEHERGQKVGLWVLAIDLGLLFGPLVGGFMGLAGDAWIQWLAAILFGVILLAELAFLPETLYPRDLMLSQTRARGGSTSEASEEEKGATSRKASKGAGVARTKDLSFANVKPVPGIIHPKIYDTIIRFLKTFKYSVVPISVMTYCFGWYWWVLSVVTLLPVAYATYSPQSQGLLYLGLIIGTLISEVLCSGSLSDWLIVKLAKRGDCPKTPEMRLWFAYPAAVLTAVGMIVWGISVDRGYHWMVGQVALALFGAGIQMGNTAVCSYIFDAYPMQSMATMTFYAVMLNLSAFIDPFFIVPWVENIGFTWTFAGHAIITVFFCIPVLGLVHRFGPLLRDKAGTPTWVNPEFSSDPSVSGHLSDAATL